MASIGIDGVARNITSCYIGVDNVARKIKKIYIGDENGVARQCFLTTHASITSDNISTYFTVTNGSTYYFAGSGSIFISNNGGINNSTATTTLTAKYNMPEVSFDYSYSSESNYDKFTLVVAGTTVERAVSGATTNKTWSGTLNAGQTIEFKYAKDSSQHSYKDKCTFSNMKITASV